MVTNNKEYGLSNRTPDDTLAKWQKCQSGKDVKVAKTRKKKKPAHTLKYSQKV